MLNSFMAEKEDEEHIIYLVARACASDLENLGPSFYLIMSEFYKHELIHDQAVLDWLASARQKIEESENNPFGSAVSTQEESKAAAQEQDADSYYGEEGNS